VDVQGCRGPSRRGRPETLPGQQAEAQCRSRLIRSRPDAGDAAAMGTNSHPVVGGSALPAPLLAPCPSSARSHPVEGSPGGATLVSMAHCQQGVIRVQHQTCPIAEGELASETRRAYSAANAFRLAVEYF